MRAIRRFTVRTVLPEPLAPLAELAANLRWSWHAPTRDLFAAVDPRQWEAVGHDPVRLLGAVRTERLAVLAADGRFTARIADAAANLSAYLTEPKWYQSLSDAPRGVAYFSPEYGITGVLPQYSGGLGILAGDHLKAASDLGVPLIGVGLLYKHGYFRQSLSRDGWQLETYPLVDPDNLPLTRVRELDGSALKITIGLPNLRELVAQVWLARVGRVPLLLLDTDIEENADGGREITDRLYGGSSEHRLHQEMLLGIGGIRAVRAYCRITETPEPEVYHTNEGHAGFLGIERIRELTEEQGLEFGTALAAVRAGTLFTTHTPVPAGIDRFAKDLVAQHFGGDNTNPGVRADDVLALGAEDYPGGDPGCFNMAVMGLRLAQRANGVSLLHGQVSREMFGGLWPGFDAPEVPISSVTNGVHAETWVHPSVFELAERELGPGTLFAEPFQAVDRLSDKTIWEIRCRLRAELVREARSRVKRSWLARGASEAELGWTEDVLDPNALTIGFARRVPSYKRLTLMLRDPERLTALLLNSDRPVQLVIAGKAHPADEGGKRLIQELVRFADESHVRHRIVFLPDYDMAMAQVLLPGCDVWLNNPLRPLEACGTSGMKAALNGGLNLSIRDGWWDEWYDGENGWAIPTADGIEDPDRRDELEAAALYDLIENSVSRRFYDRDAADLPIRWIEMVRHTLTTLGPKVLASRMVRDYVKQLYTPAAKSARAVSADGYRAAAELATWTKKLRDGWPALAIEHVDAAATDAEGAEVAEGGADAPRLGGMLRVRALVQLGPLAPDDLEVQAVYGRVDEYDQLRDTQTVALELHGVDDLGRNRYEGVVELDRSGPFGYTVRVVPRHSLLSTPAELGLAALPAPSVVATSPLDSALR
ncbi:MAG TPA: alpha-glucan family phosphorylase [Actinocrinis sp.]|jgi:starch phosphorylase|uniref:alpha-glucan family phosphorylase n=1 Tax=Actinocrinis sp. TaxID=1920516 RepID=UPI002DDD1F13|nr:alpha-glucan family phosphorylase [Actinocrinis sp.]HEV3170500.1 alpha-glucan family phosphorylase [Actinocrinis sp.]